MDYDSDNSSIMEIHTNGQYDDLILKMNRLREIYTRAGMSSPPIEFPIIVVIGGQSSGKSSVLESFVGKDFLPRGGGTVTRCPLILNLVHTHIPKEYGCFEHTGETQFLNFEEIKKEIIKQTTKINGENHGISDEPIKLTIYSDKVVNLTLIDTPGVTRVPKGDQPKDIEKITRDLIMKYINEENCIILAVSAANQDLNLSDALMLAKEADPDGIRTIGVLTKLDIMDKGTNALSSLVGNGPFPLRLGYVAVQNRSQEDIDKGVDIDEARKREEKFFSESPIYKDMKERMGSKYLLQKLNTILTKKIEDKIPEIKHYFEQQFLEYELKQEKFCGFLDERQKFNEMDEKEMMSYLRRERARQICAMFDEFNKQIGKNVFGHIDWDVISRGAQINQIITIDHSNKIDAIFLDRKDLIKKLKILILNWRGVYGGIFTPDDALAKIISYLIDLYGKPSIDCLSEVTNLLRLIVDDCVKKASRYPTLRDSARSVIKSFVGHSMCKTQEHITYVIEFQKSMINDQHEDFEDVSGLNDTVKRIPISTIVTNLVSNPFVNTVPIALAVAENVVQEPVLEPINDNINSNNSSHSGGEDEEDEEDEDFKNRIEMIVSYSNILRKAFKDFIPKVIIHSLIDKTRLFLKEELDSELDSKYPLNDLMEISEEERLEVEDFLRKKSVIQQVLAELNTF